MMKGFILLLFCFSFAFLIDGIPVTFLFSIFFFKQFLLIKNQKVGKKVKKPKDDLAKSKVKPVGGDAKVNGGGIEGDMIFPQGINPKSSTRGVAIYGNRQWPNGIIPYDISSITGIEHKSFFLFFSMNSLLNKRCK